MTPQGPADAARRSFAGMWESLLPLGRDPGSGGYRRYSFTDAEAACREWFFKSATERNLRAAPDRNGNLWAWWDAGTPGRDAGATGRDAGTTGRDAGTPGFGAVVTGSHLDSVPDGGAYDGALGVVSAFAAIDELRARGFVPARPVAVAAFLEEEGARFGVACLGSRLACGVIAPERARELRDGDGVRFADAMAAAGLDPAAIGADSELLSRLYAYVELHIEQGRALAGTGAAVAVGSGIWPHGRWLLEFAGRADHAGTTRLADRRDPMLPYAAAVLAARQAAAGHGTLATFGKVIAEPGGANGISSVVRAWLDARAPDEALLQQTVQQVEAAAAAAASEHGVTVIMRSESVTAAVEFDHGLRDRLAGVLARGLTGMAGGSGAASTPAADAVPILATAAGHDAGVLAARLPTAMLFVRNPTGVSHSPAEHADLADCESGVAALAAVLADLAGR
jgi:beta-ureidopropionase / N-carbamoyl-L-amino-acid hydrolase